MTIKIMLFLLIPVFVFAQVGLVQKPFASTDTIGTITDPDSVEIQLGDGPWKLLTECQNDTAYVTADDKVAETTQVFQLADESYWTYATSIRFRVYATGTDTITSNRVSTGGLRGAITLFLRPDTTGTNTKYGDSTVEGN